MTTSRKKRSPWAAAALILAASCILIPVGCGGGGGDEDPSIPSATLSAVLSGTQQVPVTGSAATGAATVQIDGSRNTITVILTTSGLVDVTAARIHFGQAGVNGGALFTLFAGQGSFTSPFIRTLTSADFTEDALNGINTFTRAAEAMLGGNAYINIHTQANPNGAIRGQIGPAILNATVLRASQVIPEPEPLSPATGSATVSFDRTQSIINVTLATSGLGNVTEGHINFGKAGQSGGIIFNLFTSPAGFFPTMTRILTAAHFLPTAGVATFDDAVNAILSGNAFITIHTQANPNGAIRGQIGPARFTAALSGAQEVPPNASPATGTATVRFDATQSAIDVTVQAQGFTTGITASRMHAGPAGTNGGFMFTLFPPPLLFPITLTRTLTSADFTPVTDVAANYADGVNTILSGNAYIKIHTLAFPAGEIRGQLAPQ